MSEEWKTYPKSKNENFFIKDTIAHPHPYCITPKHLEYSEEIYLDIEGAEKKGAVCDICAKNVYNRMQDRILSYKEHEQGLLVGCLVDFQNNEEAKKELEEYLISLKEKAEKDKYTGFAFLDLSKKEEKKTILENNIEQKPKDI